MIRMTIKDRIDELEQRVYELECVLKHYPKPFNIPPWMRIDDDVYGTSADGTIDIEWDWEL